MILDENEVIPLHGTLYVKMEFCKRHPIFKTKFNEDFFNQTPQHHLFCTFYSYFLLQKSLGYTIKKPKDSTEFSKKNRFSRKLKITKFMP